MRRKLEEGGGKWEEEVEEFKQEKKMGDGSV